MEDGRAEIPLNITVQGDVLIVIYHARSVLGGRLQAKVRLIVANICVYCPNMKLTNTNKLIGNFIRNGITIYMALMDYDVNNNVRIGV